jgi:hypothetical protein
LLLGISGLPLAWAQGTAHNSPKGVNFEEESTALEGPEGKTT